MNTVQTVQFIKYQNQKLKPIAIRTYFEYPKLLSKKMAPSQMQIHVQDSSYSRK